MAVFEVSRFVRGLPLFLLLGLASGCQRSAPTKADAEHAPSAAGTTGDPVAPPREVAAGEAPPSPSPPAAKEAPDASPPPFRTYTNIVHVGDSTVGYTQGLQLEMRKKLEPLGIHYESHTKTSAGLRAFAASKIVEQLVTEKKPDLLIIQLGTNNLTVPNPKAFLPAIDDILAQVGDRPCYWIGPIPLEQKEHGMRALLRDSVAPCRFYDSYDLKLERQSDHVHPTQRAAKKWAEAFFTFAETTPPGKRLLPAP